jgi:hypothetical protein
MNTNKAIAYVLSATLLGGNSALIAGDGEGANKPAPQAHKSGPEWAKNGKFWKEGEARLPVAQGGGTVQAGYAAMTKTETLFFPVLWSYCSRLCGKPKCTEKVCRPPHGHFGQSLTETEELARQLTDQVTSAVKSSSTFEKSFGAEAQWKLSAGNSLVGGAEFTGKISGGLKASDSEEFSRGLTKSVSNSVKTASSKTSTISVDASQCQASELTYWMVARIQMTVYDRAVKYLSESGERRGAVIPASSWSDINRRDNGRAGGNEQDPPGPEITITIEFELEGPLNTECDCGDSHDAPPVPTPGGGNNGRGEHHSQHSHHHAPAPKEVRVAQQIVTPAVAFAEGTVTGVVTDSHNEPVANVPVTASIVVANGTVTATTQTDTRGRFTLRVPKQAQSILFNAGASAGVAAVISRILQPGVPAGLPAAPPRLVQTGTPFPVATGSPIVAAEYQTPAPVQAVVATAESPDHSQAVNAIVAKVEPGNVTLKAMTQSGLTHEWPQTAYRMRPGAQNNTPQKIDFAGVQSRTVKTEFEVGAANAYRQYQVITQTTGPVTATPASQIVTADGQGVVPVLTTLQSRPLPGQSVPYTATTTLQDDKSKQQQEAEEKATKAAAEAGDHEKKAAAAEQKGDHRKAAEERENAAQKFREAEREYKKAGEPQNAAEMGGRALENFEREAEDYSADGEAHQGTKRGNDSFNKAGAIHKELGDHYARQARREGKNGADSWSEAAKQYDKAADAYNGSGSASDRARAKAAAAAARQEAGRSGK